MSGFSVGDWALGCGTVSPCMCVVTMVLTSQFGPRFGTFTRGCRHGSSRPQTLKCPVNRDVGGKVVRLWNFKQRSQTTSSSGNKRDYRVHAPECFDLELNVASGDGGEASLSLLRYNFTVHSEQLFTDETRSNN